MMKSNILTQLICLPLFYIFLLAGSVAQQISGWDVVVLKNGVSCAGSIIEDVPGRHLRIQTGSGSTYTFTYGEIQKVQRGQMRAPGKPVQDRIADSPVPRSYVDNDFIAKEKKQKAGGVSLMVGQFRSGATDFEKYYGNASGIAYNFRARANFSQNFALSADFIFFLKTLQNQSEEVKWQEWIFGLGGLYYLTTTDWFSPFIGVSVIAAELHDDTSVKYNSILYWDPLTQRSRIVTISEPDRPRSRVGYSFCAGADIGSNSPVYISFQGQYVSVSAESRGLSAGGSVIDVGGIFLGAGLGVRW